MFAHEFVKNQFNWFNCDFIKKRKLFNQIDWKFSFNLIMQINTCKLTELDFFSSSTSFSWCIFQYVSISAFVRDLFLSSLSATKEKQHNNFILLPWFIQVYILKLINKIKYWMWYHNLIVKEKSQLKVNILKLTFLIMKNTRCPACHERTHFYLSFWINWWQLETLCEVWYLIYMCK